MSVVGLGSTAILKDRRKSSLVASSRTVLVVTVTHIASTVD